MEISGRHSRQILLLSLVVLIIPMIVFPARFGTGLAQMSLLYIGYEVVFYMVAAFGLLRRASLLPLFQAAAICLVYRLVLGATFGLLIAAMYSMNLRVSLMLGLFSYLPALLLHVVMAPFILTAALKVLLGTSPRRMSAAPPVEGAETARDGKTTFVTTTSQRGQSAPASRPIPEARPQTIAESAGTVRPGDISGFERATRYLAEHGSVLVAAVVDNEGLLLGHFQRGEAVAEDWAPLALLFYEQNQAVIDRFGGGVPERVTLRLPKVKVVLAREELFYFMVVAETQSDDLLGIRFSQGLEMVKKYVAERYDGERAANPENAYVRSTQ